MRVELKSCDNNVLPAIEDIPSGKLVEYRSNDLNDNSFGIVLKDPDGENPVIFDLENDEYYNDIENYMVVKVFSYSKYKLVVDDTEGLEYV